MIIDSDDGLDIEGRHAGAVKAVGQFIKGGAHESLREALAAMARIDDIPHVKQRRSLDNAQTNEHDQANDIGILAQGIIEAHPGTGLIDEK